MSWNWMGKMEPNIMGRMGISVMELDGKMEPNIMGTDKTKTWG